jgi:IPT/TIG domain
MSVNVQHVHSGDLITAGYMNGIADAINELQAEIDALGSGGSPPPGPGAPIITSTSPSPDVPAGTTLTINGQNFEVPQALNSITLGGKPMSDFVGFSSDQVVNIVVPGDIASTLPATLELVLTTTGGSANTNVHVVAPVVPLIGAVVVKNASGAMPAPNVGDTMHFEFTLDANAVNMPEQYHVVVAFTNANGSSIGAWAADTTYVGVDGNQMVTVDPSDPATVGVDVKVPTGATSVDMTISAVSMHNDPASSSNQLAVPITVGQAGPTADPSIHLTLGTNASALLHSQNYTGAVAGTGLAVKYGSNPVIEINLGVDNPATYTVSGTVVNADNTMWVVTGLPIDVPFAEGQPPQNVHFHLQLVPTTASATDVTRFFNLTVTRKDETSVSNFLQFPVGGF